jgi:hypothetical protein
MLLLEKARVLIRRSSFRDIDLGQEIFDVSRGSSVRLENCTFTNITVPDNDYVSTSYNDFEAFRGETLEVPYYPDDDAGPWFDLQRHRAKDSRFPEEGMCVFFKEVVEEGGSMAPAFSGHRPECHVSKGKESRVQGWTLGLMEHRR